MFFETIPVSEYIKGALNGHGFNSHQFQSIRGRVVEGTGLIIRFPLERHWFEPSRMQVNYFCILFFLQPNCKIIKKN